MSAPIAASDRFKKGWRARLYRRLGFEFGLMGQGGSGDYYAWEVYYHVGRWTLHFERYIGNRYLTDHPEVAKEL